MNIFIDTSILYKDPFWTGNYYKELIETVNIKEVHIFISNVVLLELEKNYADLIDKTNQEITVRAEKLKRYQFGIDHSQAIDAISATKSLKSFYAELARAKTITLLDYQNDFLPEIVNRAVWKKKPFSANKTEVKDLLIWLTYSRYAEKNAIRNCILLTDNISDFCDQGNIHAIHPDLLADSDRFKVYRSVKELVEAERKKLQYALPKFQRWLNMQKFDRNFVYYQIDDNFLRQLHDKIEDQLRWDRISELLNLDEAKIGNLYVTDTRLEKVDEVTVSVFKEECLISCIAYVECDLEFSEYVADGEDEEFDSGTVNVSVPCSFYYNRREVPWSFQVEPIIKYEYP